MTDELKPGHCHKCGLQLSDNPHPEAGKPSHYLKVGCPKECVPCLTLSRHQWAGRAMKAENELADARALLSASKPAALTDLLPNALWTRHGSGEFERWSFKRYEARKDGAEQWVLRKGGEEQYRHTYLQVVMAHAERELLAASPAAPAQSSEPVGKAVPMPGASGSTMAVFEASEIPVGTDLYAAPQPSPTAVVLDDLSTLVVRLVRELRKASPDHPLPPKALDYLYRKDLSPSVLRGGKFGEFAEPLSKQPGESHDKPA